MRVVLAFAVIGVCVILALWVLGIVGASDALDGTVRTLGVVAIGGGGMFAVFALLRSRRAAGETPDRSGNGPRF